MNLKSDWYKTHWLPGMRDAPWLENTIGEVDFIVEKLQLTGDERVLDMACGSGRHSLELSRRGFRVMGVDITQEYVEMAQRLAKQEGLTSEFFRADVRDLKFSEEFDVILNMSDGAIGYLEDDGENLRIFDLITKALTPNGGKHFMSILNGLYYKENCPIRSWSKGEKGILLSQHEWLSDTKRVVHTGELIKFGDVLGKVEDTGRVAHYRLYDEEEIRAIFCERSMSVIETYQSFSSTKTMQISPDLLVYSIK